MRLEDKEALIVHALFYINAKSEEFLDSNIMKSTNYSEADIQTLIRELTARKLSLRNNFMIFQDHKFLNKGTYYG